MVRGTYRVTFPLFAKSDFNGSGASEVAKFLRVNTPFFNGKKGTLTVPWNYAKWIIDENGKVVNFH